MNQTASSEKKKKSLDLNNYQNIPVKEVGSIKCSFIGE